MSGHDDAGADGMRLTARVEEQYDPAGDMVWVLLFSAMTHGRRALDRFAEKVGCELVFTPVGEVGMSGGWDELINEAKAHLAEQEAEEQDASAELGDSVDLDEHEAFTGRWRGYGKAWTKRGEVDVFLLWDAGGPRRFAWPKMRLQREIDELQPNVGDEIAIVRGVDIPSSDPDRNPTQRFAVRVRSSSAPLPDEGHAVEPSAAAPVDDNIPFMPTL